MMCYKDMTFCTFYKECDAGSNCSRALTKEVEEGDKRWWGNDNAPISKFVDKPECFVVIP